MLGSSGIKPTTSVHSISSGAGKEAAADAKLAAMGYAPELKRNLGMMTILGLSFSIIAAPFGLSTAFSIALTCGGPITILYGWVAVSLISLCIAASLAEICSQFPSSGGVYVWAAFISTPKWAPVASWIVGWVSLVGNWTLCLSINFGGAQLIMAGISIFRDDLWAPEPYQTILTFWACMVVSAVINAFGVKGRYLDALNRASFYWTGATCLIIMITVLVMAKDGRRSAEFVFSGWENTSGWPDGWAFFVGLLQAAYTLTGYGTVAALCEEVENPEREVPRAMVWSVVAASLTGLAYLIPILFILTPDSSDLLSAAAGQPLAVLFHISTGSKGGGFALLFLLLGVFAFAGVGSLTVALRCTWAFARDGAIPGSKHWSKVHEGLGLPLNSLLLSTVVVSLLGLIYFGSTAAFSAFTGVATICLSISYGVPIAIALLRRRVMLVGAPFSLGERLGYLINTITFVWITLATVLFCMPTTREVTSQTMNYASVVFAFFFALSAFWWVVWGRLHYVGPLGAVEERSGEEDRIHPSPSDGEDRKEKEVERKQVA
ncbi:amino acid transporter [Violaceomyces palustris]|uniref:Amino acid transporter n=1 Tax=Violaceomyces palustris TaxID=1673888 RepID=A0ACD0NQM5_9BASI|nr:amino acid transporter [Violaceomyces palustris]